MANAKIEVWARSIEAPIALPGEPQHLFIIYTDSDEKKTILRGGPENPGLINMLQDNLKIIKSSYLEVLKDSLYGDFVKNAPSQIIATGTDAEMQALVDKMWARGQEINNGKFDYKFPTPGCSPEICHVQNSNTAVRVMVESAGLRFALPQVNNKDVWAPGVNGDIRHTILDTTMRTTADYGYQAIDKATDTLVELKNSVLSSTVLSPLHVWQDKNGNGKIDNGEMSPAKAGAGTDACKAAEVKLSSSKAEANTRTSSETLKVIHQFFQGDNGQYTPIGDAKTGEIPQEKPGLQYTPIDWEKRLRVA